MGQLIAYLTFNGNCREAMEFYRECLGGELRLQTVGESPKSEELPKHFKEYIVQASLIKDNLILMGTDLADEELLRGNAFSILLDCNNEEQLKTYYQNLETGGKAIHAPKETNWGELFGGLIDKYGNQWLFHCNPSAQMKPQS